MDYFDSFERYAFRLELLQSYNVPNERKSLEEFKQTGKFAFDSRDWNDLIKRARSRNATMSRVHVVRPPLSDYLKWELKGYESSVNAGEEVRILLEDVFRDLETEINFDFWLFDDKIVLKMNYDESGKFLSNETLEGDIETFVTLKNLLLEKSVHLNEFKSNINFS